MAPGGKNTSSNYEPDNRFRADEAGVAPVETRASPMESGAARVNKGLSAADGRGSRGLVGSKLVSNNSCLAPNPTCRFAHFYGGLDIFLISLQWSGG